MFSRDFHPTAFLRRLIGSEPFFEYCRERGIPFGEFGGSPHDDMRRWSDTLRASPKELQAQVELEFAQVNELSGRDGMDHLLASLNEGNMPPTDIPAGTPLSLWFLLHQREVFDTVFLQHEVREVRSWRFARTEPNLSVNELAARTETLAKALRQFFRIESGTGQFCAAEARQVSDAVCFAAHIADRLRLVEAFTDSGTLSLESVRPALSVLFAYYPADGQILLKSHLRAMDRVNALLRCFGETVLRANIAGVVDTYVLDRLKQPFRPLPDAPDMEDVRVKSLHLRYPPSRAGRLLKLETRSNDASSAIEELLRLHIGTSDELERLRVCYAELEVRLRVDGRRKVYPVRLWPDRCSLNQTPLGIRLRHCLSRWNLIHA